MAMVSIATVAAMQKKTKVLPEQKLLERRRSQLNQTCSTGLHGELKSPSANDLALGSQ
jgi:hypothetical protein